MKIKLTITFLLLINSLTVCSQENSERKALLELLNERKARFGTYSEAAAARSGIFGNKTRGDLRRSNDILIEIIKVDNRMIALLNNFLSYRSFQKNEMSYSFKEQDDRIKSLVRITDTLSSQVQILKAENAALKKDLKISAFFKYMWAFLAVIFGTIIIYWYRNNRHLKHPV